MLEIRLHPTPVISTLARCSVRRIAVRASPSESVGESGFPRTSASHLEATVGPERKFDLRPRVATRTSQPGGGRLLAGPPRSDPSQCSYGRAQELQLKNSILWHDKLPATAGERTPRTRRTTVAADVFSPPRWRSLTERHLPRPVTPAGFRASPARGTGVQRESGHNMLRPQRTAEGAARPRSPGAVTDTVARSCEDIAPMTSGLTIALRTGTAATSCSPCCGMAPSSTPPKAV